MEINSEEFIYDEINGDGDGVGIGISVDGVDDIVVDSDNSSVSGSDTDSYANSEDEYLYELEKTSEEVTIAGLTDKTIVESVETAIVESVDKTMDKFELDTSEHFSKDIWKNLAKIDPKIKDVIMMLSKIIIVNKKPFFPAENNLAEIKCYGKFFNIFFFKEKYNKNIVGHNKYVLENTKNIIESNIREIDMFFEGDKWDFVSLPHKQQTGLLEIRCYLIIKALQCIQNKIAFAQSKFNIIDFLKKNEEPIYEMIIVAQKMNKFILEKDDTFNNLKMLLRSEILKTKRMINFIPTKIFKSFPRLLNNNKFENLLQKDNTLKPMTHQIELLQQIIDNFTNGFLIKYTVMAGCGKTVSAISIGKIIENLNKTPNFEKNKITLIFTCNIDAVRLEVAKMLFHTGITFGIVAYKYWQKKTDRNSEDWFIQKHSSCIDENPTVLITGPEFAVSVIKSIEEKKGNVVLFLDEPTVGADKLNSFGLKTNSKLLINLPKRTILSSATLPAESNFKFIYEIYKNKFPTANLCLPPITFMDVKNTCKLYKYDGFNLHVFSDAKTSDEVSKMAQNIESNPFLKKLCGFNSLNLLHANLVNEKVIPDDLGEWLDNFDNLSPNEISKKTLSLLKIFADLKNKKIKFICAPNKRKKDVYHDHLIRFNELFDQWGAFDGMNLIASENPVAFVKQNFKKHLDDLKTKYNFRRENAKYKISIQKYNELLEQQANKSSCKKKSVVVGSNGKFKTIIQEEDDHSDDLVYPQFFFPEEFIINTQLNCNYNCKKNKDFVCSHATHLIGFPFASDMSYDNQCTLADITLDDDLILLLLCGIGIYSKTIVDEKYKNFVLDYASKGYLSYVIADETICFGTNYPFTRAFITPEFAKIHSMETIMQVIARCGRLGLAYKAEAFIPKCLRERLHCYISEGKDNTFDEGKNISMQVKYEFLVQEQKQTFDKLIAERNFIFSAEIKLPLFVKACENHFNEFLANKTRGFKIVSERAISKSSTRAPIKYVPGSFIKSDLSITTKYVPKTLNSVSSTSTSSTTKYIPRTSTSTSTSSTTKYIPRTSTSTSSSTTKYIPRTSTSTVPNNSTSTVPSTSTTAKYFPGAFSGSTVPSTSTTAKYFPGAFSGSTVPSTSTTAKYFPGAFSGLSKKV